MPYTPKCGFCGADITDKDIFPDICNECIPTQPKPSELLAQGKPVYTGCCDEYRDANIWPTDPIE